MPTDVRAALEALGEELPQAGRASPHFVPVAEHQGVVYVAGQIAFEDDGSLRHVGRLGEEVGVADGQAAARRCALHLLAQLQAHLGSLERIERVLKLQVYVASAPGFVEQSLVANGASELLAAVLGEERAHTRTAIGVAALPFGAVVELDAIVACRPA